VEPFVPVPFQIVNTPEQLKAFTDPLRGRILSILCEREATNQQVAQALGEPHAKVLHHVRYLLDAGLIRLVDTRIKGGNVEKYYRAVARMFGIRAGRDLLPDVTVAEFEALSQEVAASAVLWPEPPDHPNWEGRTARLSPERLEEFHQKLLALIAEYWGGPHRGGDTPDVSTAIEDPTAPVHSFAAVIYRDPTDQTKSNAKVDGT
jgi:DNA-binding transcriptional ArsR family regulator